MVDSESKKTRDREEEEILGTPNTERRKRKRHLREENRSRECSNSRKMMEQWSGLSEKEGDVEEKKKEEATPKRADMKKIPQRNEKVNERKRRNHCKVC